MSDQCTLHETVWQVIQEQIGGILSTQKDMAKTLNELALSAEAIKRLHDRQDDLNSKIDKRIGHVWEGINEMKKAPWKIGIAFLPVVLTIGAALGGLFIQVAQLKTEFVHASKAIAEIHKIAEDADDENIAQRTKIEDLHRLMIEFHVPKK